jgi:ABC-type transporter Mla subunit MlaD
MRAIFFVILATAVLALVLFLSDPQERVVGTYSGTIVEFVPRQGKFRNGPERVSVKLPNGNVVIADMWINRGALLPSGTAARVQERSGSWFGRHTYWVQADATTPIGP